MLAKNEIMMRWFCCNFENKASHFWKQREVFLLGHRSGINFRLQPFVFIQPSKSENDALINDPLNHRYLKRFLMPPINVWKRRISASSELDYALRFFSITLFINANSFLRTEENQTNKDVLKYVNKPEAKSFVGWPLRIKMNSRS